jgi:hypothetical protein
VPGYLVGGRLGSGGSADVWSATAVTDGRPCALKVIVPQRFPTDALQVGRELAVLRGVRHPHVVSLLDDLVLADGRTVLVLDLVAGGSLARVVRARGHLTPGETTTVLTTLAAALADLHRMGIVHGDLTPGNVLLHLDGRPMLADVGLARLAGDPEGLRAGTSGFVDPAALAGGAVDATADVYALGALGWFALTGAVPASLLRPALRDVLPDLPGELAAVIEAALDPEPGARTSAAELAHASHLAVRAAPVRLAGDRDPADLLTHRIRLLAAADEAAPPGQRRSGARWRPGVTAVAAIGCLAATVIGASAATTGETAQAATPATVHRAVVRPTAGRATASRAVARPSASPAPPWEEIATALTVARSRAFGQPGLGAAAFDRVGSAAWRDDDEALALLQGSGLRYRGLRIEPTTTAVLSGSVSRALLRLTYRTSAYDVVAVSGAVLEHRSAGPLTTVRLSVEHTESGWRAIATTTDR